MIAGHLEQVCANGIHAVVFGDSRVALEVIIAEHKKGATPERIAEEYDTLHLADVYAAIAYYLRHAEEVAAYLERRREEAAAMQKKVADADMTRPDLGAVVRTRWAQQQEPRHAGSPRKAHTGL